MIKFHDPRGESAVQTQPYELAHDIQSNEGDGVTVALLANGFPDSDNFVEALGKALKERLPKIQTKFWNKGNASIPANEQILNEIQSSCQVAIAAYGH